jgi:predicted enzyme related to lactoylglutathione lyase
MPQSNPLFKKIDCIRLPVPDLEAALAFYSGQLGHQLIWRTRTAAGLAMPQSDAEIVLYTDVTAPEIDLLVESADQTAEQIIAAGGKVIAGPFEIQIGRCAVVQDPWGNELVLLDMSKGRLITDADGNIIGNEPTK